MAVAQQLEEEAQLVPKAQKAEVGDALNDLASRREGTQRTSYPDLVSPPIHLPIHLVDRR